MISSLIISVHCEPRIWLVFNWTVFAKSQIVTLKEKGATAFITRLMFQLKFAIYQSDGNISKLIRPCWCQFYHFSKKNSKNAILFLVIQYSRGKDQTCRWENLNMNASYYNFLTVAFPKHDILYGLILKLHNVGW